MREVAAAAAVSATRADGPVPTWSLTWKMSKPAFSAACADLTTSLGSRTDAWRPKRKRRIPGPYRRVPPEGPGCAVRGSGTDQAERPAEGADAVAVAGG